MHCPLLRSLKRLIWLVSVTIIGLALVADAWAQCEYLTGPSRTDCFIGRARILGSDIAAEAARLRADQEFLRAATGTSVQPKPQTSRSKHRVRLK
jgi:hypothetical protein